MNGKIKAAITVTVLVGASQFFGTVANAAVVNKYKFDQVVKNLNNSGTNASFYTIGNEASLALFSNGNQGLAMRFPPMDTNQDTDGAILEVSGDGERLDPGSENMLIQVNVRLDPSLVDNDVEGLKQGMNIVQKGAFKDAQWKLQIDRRASDGAQELGCRFAEAEGTQAAGTEAFAKMVVSGINAQVNLFDGKWRTIKCSLNEGTVTLSVGGNESQDYANLGPISNDKDVNIGGLKRANGLVNDQFHGEMDNLIITIGD